MTDDIGTFNTVSAMIIAIDATIILMSDIRKLLAAPSTLDLRSVFAMNLDTSLDMNNPAIIMIQAIIIDGRAFLKYLIERSNMPAVRVT